MKFKKIMAVALAVVLTLSVLAGCGKTEDKTSNSSTSTETSQNSTEAVQNSGVDKIGFPIVKDKITLKGFSRKDPQHSKDYKDMWLWQEMEKKTNIHIEWDTPDIQNVTERLNLILATNDLPDFIMKNGGPNVNAQDRLINYASKGTFIQLDKYIDEYAPNLKQLMEKTPSIKADITAPDGHIYSLPTVTDYLVSRVGRYPLLNMKWLNKVGLQPPKSYDEWLNILRAFRDKDPNENGQKDEVAFDAHTLDFLMNATIGMFGFDNIEGIGNIEDEKVNIGWDDDRYKEVLKTFKLLYNEKLIDQDIFTQTDQKFFAKLADNKIGFTALYQPRNAGKYANDYDAIEPIKGPKGEQIWSFLTPLVNETTSFIITKANKYPEATMRWADFFYSDEGSTMMYSGPDGTTSEKTADGFKFKKEILESTNGFENEMGKYVIFPGGGALGYYAEKQLKPTMEGTPMVTYIDKVKNYIPKTKLASPLMSPEDSAKVTQLRKDISTYAKDMRAKFILGREDIDKGWDAYVKQLQTMGMKDYEQIMTDAYIKK